VASATECRSAFSTQEYRLRVRNTVYALLRRVHPGVDAFDTHAQLLEHTNREKLRGTNEMAARSTCAFTRGTVYALTTERTVAWRR